MGFPRIIAFTSNEFTIVSLPAQVNKSLQYRPKKALKKPIFFLTLGRRNAINCKWKKRKAMPPDPPDADPPKEKKGTLLFR